MKTSLPGRFAAPLVATLLLLAQTGLAPAHDSEVSSIGARTSLYVFGPEIPFMFEVDGQVLNFRWSDLRSYGDTAIGTLTEGAGEVIGVDGEYWVADATDPVPRKLTDEVTPAGAVVSFFATDSFRIDNPVDLGALQTVLDDVFADSGTFIYLFRARGTLASVEYQLAGPLPNPEIRRQVEAGDSQAALTIGTRKYTATDVPMTMIGVRAPPHLNTVLQVPYHIHFLADDRSVLGHVTALETDDLTIEWTKVNAVNVHYWDVR